MTGFVVVLGAAGFVGRSLQSRLASGGYSVRAVLSPDEAAAAGAGQDIETVQRVVADLTDPKSLSAAVVGASAVIYCASTVRGAYFEDFLPLNVAALACLADVLEAQPEIAFLHLSSLVASRPELSWFARSKAAGEALLQQRLEQAASRDLSRDLSREQGAGASSTPLNWTVLRVPAVYGPGESDLMPLLRTLRRGFVPIPGNVEQRLSLLHVSDLTEAVAAWLGNPAACQGGVFALDDGHIVGYDWGQIAQAAAPGAHFLFAVPRFLLRGSAAVNLRLARTFGYAPMLTPGKVAELLAPDWVCDNAEFCAATGWEPKIDLTSGIGSVFL